MVIKGFWLLLFLISFLVAVADFFYKVGSTELKINDNLSIKGYLEQNLIIFSYFLTVITKLLIGIPYANLKLSIAVPVNNILVAFLGSLMGVVFLKEKIDKYIIFGWLFAILSFSIIIYGEVE